MAFTAEQQAEIDAMIEAATGGLKSKNTELLAELKKARKSAEITPEQLSEVEAERDKLQSDLQAAHKQVKDATKAAETASKALEQESGFTQKLLIDNGLTAGLMGIGVTDKDHIESLTARFRGQVQIVADGENRVAKVGDKALSDFMKEFGGTDTAKKYQTAPNNSGGGAAGGGGAGGAGKTMSRTDFNAKSQAERAAFATGGGKVID